ncbi:MAG: hypothetical protein ACRDN8_15250, partial [Thermoleophilaceae bacterium]
MPKPPRNGAKSGTPTASKAPAKPAAPASDGSGSAAAKRRTAVKRKARRDGGARGGRDFERHPVDEHTG